jgi:membrane protease YdiL (CAAX protease family)
MSLEQDSSNAAPDPPSEELTPGTEPPVDPQPADRHEVFWGYAELFLFLGLAVPAMMAGLGLVRGILVLLRARPIRAAEVLTEQFAGYFFLFLILVVVFRFQYGRPFWRSLGWTRMRLKPVWIVTAGCLTALAVSIVGVLIRTPQTSNPLTELMRDPTSLLLIAIAGVTVGPLAEELLFRGFLQPLLVKSFGAAAGILLAALPFGMLHFVEYGRSWRYVLLISGAGAAFGWMRHTTGSTKASTLMHSAYNALFFVTLTASRIRGINVP